MYYVYILVSQKDKDLYIGSTPDLRRRIVEHNAGKSFSTAPRRPFTLVYYEAYLEKDDALHRESALKKRGQARRQLMTRLPSTLAKVRT
jgi:putative endonuclease